MRQARVQKVLSVGTGWGSYFIEGRDGRTNVLSEPMMA